MTFPRLLTSLLCGLLVWPGAERLAAQPLVVSELMGRNATTLADEDGDFTDWVEVYNVSDAVVNLDGWTLSDDSDEPAKWVFPARELGPRQALVVFASGKNRRPADGPLHTSFRLSGGGEFLGLFGPGEVFASGFVPRFPEQFSHASFGLRMDAARTELVADGAAVRYQFPQDDALGKSWVAPSFDDAGWTAGSLPIGFDAGETPGFGPELATDLGMPDQTTGASLYLRVPFTVAAPAALDALVLRMRYDDGFVAYVNGVEVARRNAPSDPGGRSAASNEVAESRNFFFEPIDLSSALDQLVDGENVLAIHALNSSAADLDLLVFPRLEGLRVEGATGGDRGYFAEPTPGWPNAEIFRGVAPAVTFSTTSRLTAESFQLELTTPGSSAEIRYTLDRSEPDARSPLYEGPLLIDRSVEVRARAFAAELVPGDVSREMFGLLAPDMADFSSDLPLVFFNSIGRPDPLQPGTGHVFVFEGGEDGRTMPTQAVQVASQGNMWARGSSTLTHPKKSWRLEFQDRRGEDLDVSPLGMPADGDWLLYGAHIVDPSLLRNAFMYELSNQMDRYAVRGRFCEVFLNGMDEPISRSDYVGVYSFFERIERHEDRVDVQRLDADDVEEPDISGGYILKIDRGDADEKPFFAGGRDIAAFYPDADQITDSQLAWIKAYIDGYGDSLQLEEVINPDIPIQDKMYAQYIDVDSWVDHHLLNEFARNDDGLGLSTYLFKRRDEKLEAGPIWDFDRAVGSASTGVSDNDTWQCGQFFGGAWWGRMFLDPQFWNRYREQYLNRRSTTLSEANVRAIIEGFATEIDEAHVRNFERWGTDPIDHGDWRGEVDYLSNWVAGRLTWMDTRFVSAPGFSVPAGLTEEGTEVSLTRPPGNMAGTCDADPAFPPPLDGDVYYTINGPDPRMDGGGRHPSALLHDGAPLVIDGNTLVRARTFERGAWSDLAEAGYVTAVAPIAVTEIMYNPTVNPDDTFTASNFEFIELQNVGEEPVSLMGFRMNRPRVELMDTDVFGAPLEPLGPGEYALLVRNPEAFLARYAPQGGGEPPPGMRIVGRFGSRDTLSNSGQELALSGGFGESIFAFRYEDEWHPASDGGGHSLVLIDPETPKEAYGDPASWKASAEIAGSPGTAEPTAGDGGLQRRGDYNQDGRLNIVDAIGLLDFLFRDGTGPCSTVEGRTALLDANGDGRLNLTDAVVTLDFVFGRGEAALLGGGCVRIEGCGDVCK